MRTTYRCYLLCAIATIGSFIAGVYITYKHTRSATHQYELGFFTVYDPIEKQFGAIDCAVGTDIPHIKGKIASFKTSSIVAYVEQGVKTLRVCQ